MSFSLALLITPSKQANQQAGTQTRTLFGAEITVIFVFSATNAPIDKYPLWCCKHTLSLLCVRMARS